MRGGGTTPTATTAPMPSAESIKFEVEQVLQSDDVSAEERLKRMNAKLERYKNILIESLQEAVKQGHKRLNP